MFFFPLWIPKKNSDFFCNNTVFNSISGNGNSIGNGNAAMVNQINHPFEESLPQVRQESEEGDDSVETNVEAKITNGNRQLAGGMEISCLSWAVLLNVRPIVILSE